MHQRLAGVHAEPEGHLVQPATAALQQRQRVVDAVVGYQAPVDSQEPMGTTLYKTNLTARLGCEPHVVSITPLVFRANRVRDRRVGEAADAAQLLAHDVTFELELVPVIDVLPLAAPALSEVLARRLDSVLRRLQNVDHPAHEHPRSLVLDLDHGLLARDPIVGEEHTAIAAVGYRGPSHGAAFEGHVIESHRDGLEGEISGLTLPSSHEISVRASSSRGQLRPSRVTQMGSRAS